MGPSGCGKTTTLRILMGLLEPDAGSVVLDGRDITHAQPDKRSMGIVFQNYALFENMTVRGNVEYALKFRRSSRRVALRYRRRFSANSGCPSISTSRFASSPAVSSSG